MPSFGDFLRTQYVLKIPEPSVSFASKVVIVTGANGGLGKDAVKHIVRLGAAKVIFACRSTSRGTEAKLQLESLLKCSPNVIEVWQVDLESPSSIQSFVARVNTLPRLDVVIHNAGIHAVNFRTVYGTESTIAVNIIGTFLLALQLLPKLRETARSTGSTAQVTFVGSALYDVAKYPAKHGGDVFAWYRDKANFDNMNQYNLSKLMQLYAAIKLSAAVGPVNDGGIVVNSLDPCFCKTGLAGDMTGAPKLFFKMFQSMAARPADDGARLVVEAASAPPQTHGLYMRAGVVQEYAPIAKNDKLATEVWDILCDKLEELQPGVLQNLH